MYPAILALFFLSGAAGLVYQVLWLRMLTRAFGTTTFAVSTILTAFMAGLAAGSYLSGRLLARRHRSRALRLFGLFEIGIGVYALALHAVMPLVEDAVAAAAGGLGLSFYAESLLRLVWCLVLLLPPTALMGATLPLLSQHTVVRFAHLGLRVGSLYALNTLGAMVGCFVAGFHAIGSWGVLGTTRAAACVNFAVGLAALALDVRGARRGDAEPAAEAPEAGPPAGVSYPPRTIRWAMAAFAVSGFAALGLEVVWTRLITLVFKGFTYSFSTMLTVFLAGIAGGSLAFARRADRSPDPLRLFALLEASIGLAVLALSPLFLGAEGWVTELGTRLGAGWRGHAFAMFLVGFGLLITPTFLFGATFPVVSRVAAQNLSGLGATVGGLYAANVAGGILGAFVTGYVLIPLIGADLSMRALCAALLAVGIGLLLSSPRVTASTRPTAAVLSALAALALVQLGRRDLSRAIHEAWIRPGETMTFYREGTEATVMVGESRWPQVGVEKRILVGGSSASHSNYYGLSVNRIQGVLPFLFPRAPRKVIAICFGTGVTFGTLSQFDVERIDGVEISPDVIAAAPRFGPENYDVVASPRVRLHVDDGRNYLLKTRDRFDAITMEPMPPALAGVVNFYTRDFYSLCRSRLEPGGILSQWVPLYYLGLQDVKMLYRTFGESFPHVLVFVSNVDTFLVGSDRPLDLSGRRFSSRLVSPALSRDLQVLRLDTAEGMLSTLLMGRDSMLEFAGDVPVLTDDLPLVEFTAPKSASIDTVQENARALFAFAETPSTYVVRGVEEDALRVALDERHRAREAAWAEALAKTSTGDAARPSHPERPHFP